MGAGDGHDQVASLFAAPPAVRMRRALPVLRQLRDGVVGGERLAAVIQSFRGDLLDREFARWALRRALVPGMDFAALLEWGDHALWVWLLDRAILSCTPVHVVSSGGWRVHRRSA